MRVLFAALSLPYPPTSGHRLRTWSMLQALAEEGHELAVISFVEPGETVDPEGPLARICGTVDLIPAPPSAAGVAAGWGRLVSLASGLPHGARRFRHPAYSSRLRDLAKDGAFDVVICDGVYNVGNLPPLAVPVLLNKDDVAHLILERYAAVEENPGRRIYAMMEAANVKRFERRATEYVSAVLACSDLDRSLLQELAPRGRVLVVPNVVDTEHYRPDGEGEPALVLFQGGLEWPPNRDAVEYFATTILPVLRREKSRVRFRVAGRAPEDVFRRRLESRHGVEFTGSVPDMRPEIARAAVCVVPLRVASGTRLKILEAAAMAKPMVSTRIGAEGLAFEDGREILIADQPAAFAAEVGRLLEDGRRRRDLGRAARRRVESDYSPPVLRRTLRDALQVVAPGEPRPEPAAEPA
jgi:glycosyltransferase involved in cell wall biosynthesis